MTPVSRTTVRIPTPSGFDIEAWFYLPEGQGPFPAVVMGHGLGAVKVGGLASFAERFCREGLAAAVVIDYRHHATLGVLSSVGRERIDQQWLDGLLRSDFRQADFCKSALRNF